MAQNNQWLDSALAEGKHAGDFIYRIKDTGKDSDQLGNCEVCFKPVRCVFHQVEGKIYFRDGKLYVTHTECHDRFGHEECLIASRR